MVQEAEANDPKLLKAEIARLKRDAAHAPQTVVADTEAVEAARQEGYQRGLGDADTAYRRGWDQGAKAAGQWATQALSEIVGVAQAQQANFAAELARALPPKTPMHGFPKINVRRADRFYREPPEAAPRPAANGGGHGEKMPKGERLILTALAQYAEGRTKVQVAVLTGYAVTGGAFNNYLGALRSRGWIEGGGDNLAITIEGTAALGHYDPLPTGDALLDHWRRQLGKAERMALDTVAARYPTRMSKEEIAAETGYEVSGGAFNNALGRLRTLELISGGKHGIKASDDLFG